MTSTAVLTFHFDFAGNEFQLLGSTTFHLGNYPDPMAAAQQCLQEHQSDDPSLFSVIIKSPA
jgi:hypothetical protein